MSVGNFRFFALSYSLALTKGCLKKSSFGTFYWIAIIFSSFLYTSGPRTILEMEVSVGGFLISFSTRGLENEVLGTILWNFVLVQILLLSCVFVWAEILRKVKRGSNFSQFKVESRSAEDEKSDSFPDLQTVTVCETGLTWAIASLPAGFTFIFAEVVCGEIWLVKEKTGLMGMASHPQPPLAGGVAYHGSQVTTSSVHPKLLHWILSTCFRIFVAFTNSYFLPKLCIVFFGRAYAS